MGHPHHSAQIGWGRTAWYGAEACAALACLYALAFIGYAIVRSTLNILATPDIDAGLMGTLVATWAGLALAALVIAALAAIPSALIGALSALAIRALLRHTAPTPQHAVASGLAVCMGVSLALLALLAQGIGMAWTPATAAALTFWLLAPLAIYSIAGGVASWQVHRLAALQAKRT